LSLPFVVNKDVQRIAIFKAKPNIVDDIYYIWQNYEHTIP